MKRVPAGETVNILADPFEELREKAIAKAKSEIKEAYSSEEFALIQSINAYIETSKSYNLAYERLSEWYGIYYPEIKISNPQTFIGLAMLMAENQNPTKEQLISVLNDEKKAESILSKLNSAMGRKLDGEERSALSGFAEMAYRMQSAMEVVESYITAASKRVLPNTSYLTDEKIAAELLSKAGSMERLATMPASTIQLLGAEKALFKHIKYGSKPPKYGILFKLPVINAAKKSVKGKMARMYAAKLSIALKADYYTKNFIAKELKESLDKSIERMKESTPDKPERPERPERSERYGRQQFDRGNRFDRPNRPGQFNKFSKPDRFNKFDKRPNKPFERRSDNRYENSSGNSNNKYGSSNSSSNSNNRYENSSDRRYGSNSNSYNKYRNSNNNRYGSSSSNSNNRYRGSSNNNSNRYENNRYGDKKYENKKYGNNRYENNKYGNKKFENNKYNNSNSSSNSNKYENSSNNNSSNSNNRWNKDNRNERRDNKKRFPKKKFRHS